MVSKLLDTLINLSSHPLNIYQCCCLDGDPKGRKPLESQYIPHCGVNGQPLSSHFQQQNQNAQLQVQRLKIPRAQNTYT